MFLSQLQQEDQIHLIHLMTMMMETRTTKKNHPMTMMMTVVATGDHHEEGGREIAEVRRESQRTSMAEDHEAGRLEDGTHHERHPRFSRS